MVRLRSIVFLLVVLLAGALGAQEPPTDAQILQSILPRNIGPTAMGGRVSDLSVYNKEPRIFFVAVASGGLWKTENGGITLRPVFHKESSVALGSVALCQNDPNLVWVGTGEQNNRNSTSWGDGVYKSTDGGETWTHMGLENTKHIGNIVIHPTDPNTVYVAALGHLWGPNPERGLYKTTDGGETWDLILKIDDNTGIVDFVLHPQDPEVMIAAAYERTRTAWLFESGGPGSGIHKSTDGGKTWRKITRGLPNQTHGRIALDAYLRDGDHWAATIEGREGGLYISDDAGESWTRANQLNPRPFYFSKVRIDPNDPDRIYILGVDMHYTTNRGRSVREFPMSVHVDHHAWWIDPNDSNHMINGNDGGVAQTRDRGETWEHLNTLDIGQYYAVGYDMRKPYWVYGGLQDNGSWAVPTQTRSGAVRGEDAYQVGGGDGFHVRVDPTDWRILYAESQGGAAFRLNQQTGESTFIRPPNPEGEILRFNWNTPIHLSPHNPSIVYIGAQKLFRSIDRGASWTAISPDLTTNNPRRIFRAGGVSPERTSAENHCTLITVAESPMRAGVIWTGSDDGLVYVTQDDGRTWTNVTPNIPDLPRGTWCSRVEPSRHELGRAYATFDGHRNNDYKPYVYVTEDFGQTWTKLSDSLPENHSCYVIREGRRNPSLLALGTEMGLWFSLDRGKNWTRYTSGRWPTVRVDDLAFHPRDGDLIVGTHGRSIWLLPIWPLEELTPSRRDDDILLIAPAPVYVLGRITGAWFDGDRHFSSPNTCNLLRVYYYLKADAEADPKVEVFDTAGNRIAELTGEKTAGLHLVSWNAAQAPAAFEGAVRIVLTVDGETKERTGNIERVLLDAGGSTPPEVDEDKRIRRGIFAP